MISRMKSRFLVEISVVFVKIIAPYFTVNDFMMDFYILDKGQYRRLATCVTDNQSVILVYPFLSN